ncbi:MAG: GxxExxY protein [Treponema sp.]|nr:GxxExxY protein [Treponema sp.]
MKNLTFGSASNRKFDPLNSPNNFTQRREDAKNEKINENEIGAIVVDSVYWLHNNFGSGLLENVYETIFAKLLAKKGLYVQRQVSIPIEFLGEHFDEGFRVDLFIEGKVIIELKSVEKIIPAHTKQLLTYLKLTNTKLGFIINFGSELMKNGIYRIVNGLPD